MRCSIVFDLIADSEPDVVADGRFLCNYSLVKLAAVAYFGLIHDYRIPDHRTLSDYYSASYNGIVYLSVNLGSLTDYALLHTAVVGEILRRLNLRFGVYLPILFIEVKLGNDIDKLHICFPVGIESSDILPVSVKLVCVKQTSLLVTPGYHMLTEVEIGLLLKRCKCSFKSLP